MCLSGSYWILWLRKTLVKDRHRPREAPPESGSFAIGQTEPSSEKHYFPSIHCKNCLTRIKTCIFFVHWTVTWLLSLRKIRPAAPDISDTDVYEIAVPFPSNHSAFRKYFQLNVFSTSFHFPTHLWPNMCKLHGY